MYIRKIVSGRSNVETNTNHDYLIHFYLRLYSIDGRGGFDRKHPGSMPVKPRILPENLKCITEVSL